MELPQPRHFETEGRKPTHDFLSLYSHSANHQDSSPLPQGGYLKTQDFLQPLERVGQEKEGNSSIDFPISGKTPQVLPSSPVDQRVLPGGIEAYGIGHISFLNHRVPKPEVTSMFAVAQASSSERNADENSNCSSYTGSGFMLWDESTAKKGRTRKENAVDRPVLRGETAVKMGPWSACDLASHSSANKHRNSFGSLSSSQISGQKNQSFMDMIKSARGSSQDDDLDDEDEFSIKKESSSTSQKADLRIREDGKNSGGAQKPDTSRSKHSATEQRRRSKINDRFQMLRQLIPNTDQKRDKASFLLEVIEYIQLLQEKVNKYEGPHEDDRNHERNNERHTEGYVDQARVMERGCTPSAVFAPKYDSKNMPIQMMPANVHNNSEQQDIGTLNALKILEQRSGAGDRSMHFPLSANHLYPPLMSGSTLAEPRRLTSNAENNLSRPQAQSSTIRPHSADCPESYKNLQEQGLDVEGGCINISGVYSQGLLSTLTQALRSSGVDVSKANISVQIELGKRLRDRSTVKDDEISTDNQPTRRSRAENGEDVDQASSKKHRTRKS